MEDEPEAPNPIRRYVSALLRRKWIILAVVVLGAVGGVLATRTVVPVYVARATIWITNPDQPGQQGGQGPIRSEELLRSYAWVDLMRSFTVLDPVVTELRLYLSHQPADSALFRDFRLAEEFVPGQYSLVVEPGGTYRLRHHQRGEVEVGQIRGPVGARQGFLWNPPLQSAREVRFSVTTPREAAGELAQRLNARLPTRDGNFLAVQLEGSDPMQITRVVNSVNRHFVEVASDLKRAKLDELTEILDEQLRRAEQNMMQAEIALEQFRVETITLPSEPSRPVAPGIEATRDPALTRYFDMRIEREAIRGDREMLESALDAPVNPDLLVQRLEALGADQRSTEVQDALTALVDARSERRALLRQYTDAHPAVQGATREVERLEQETLPRVARSLLAQMRSEENALDRTLGSAAGELRQIPPRAIEEARLRRDWQIKENLFTVLQQRYEEARLSAVSSIPDVRVLDPAVAPRQPINADDKVRLLLLALVGSFGLAVGGVLLWDMLDPRVQYPEQVSVDMDLNIVGVVPNARREGKLFKKGNESEVREAFRSIRLNLLHAYGSAGPVVLAISSPGSGDGKSFVAMNLARSFADLGRRTLLVDGDVRRGHLHRALETERVPGLLDALRGRVRMEEALRSTRIPNLDFIPNGTFYGNAPEILAGPELRRVLADLKAQYDVVLFDSAPLGAGVDPFVIGTLTGNLLMVLRNGETDRLAASAHLENVRRLPIRILGGVLNDVQRTSIYRYYYSYLPEYALVDEGEQEESDELIAAT